MPRWPLLQSMPMRSASAWLMATLVAPVSTMNRTALPLIAPLVTKWPPRAGGDHDLAAAAAARRAADADRRAAERSASTLAADLDLGRRRRQR